MLTKILFFTIDGIGLGHISRCLNIAKELRNIMECEILFATNSHFTDFFERDNFAFVKGGTDPLLLTEHKITWDKYIEINEDFLIKIIQNFKPHIVVADLLLLPRAITFARQHRIFCTYVTRDFVPSGYFKQHEKQLEQMDLIIAAFENCSVSNTLFATETTKKKLVYAGNIFRQPNKDLIHQITEKYGKKNNEFLITVTFGAGGIKKEVEDFFNTVVDLGHTLGKQKISFGAKHRILRWLFVRPPFYTGMLLPEKHFEIVNHEPHLPELFVISDLVISRGGYNSVHEIIAAKTPALISPISRNYDSQLQRTLLYEREGFIRYMNIEDRKECLKVFRETLKVAALKFMRSAYENYSHRNGSSLAAALIAQGYMTAPDSPKGVGLLRRRVDVTGENFIYDEAAALNEYKPLLICSEIKTLNKKIEYHLIAQKKWLSSRLPGMAAFSKKSVAFLSLLIRKSGIKILHAQFLNDAIFYASLLNKFKLSLLINIRGYDLFDAKTHRYVRTFSAKGAIFIAKSHFQKEKLLKLGCNPGSVKVIYGGINVERIPFIFRNISRGNIRILSAGRFVEKKGFDTVLKFFKNALKTYPRAELTLIGKGESENTIEQTIRRMKMGSRIHLIKEFLPHHKFIRELYRHNIFVLASKTSSSGDSEGIPNVLKEAMASGMPVISTYHAGIPELITNNETGFLIEENNHKAMVEKLKYILAHKDKVKRLCLKGRFYVEKKFNLSSTVSEIESLYSGLFIPPYATTILRMMRKERPLRFRADLHLVSGCNGSCLMCDNWKNPIGTKFSRRAVSKLLAQLRLFGVTYVRFHGQEPTLRKDIFSIMEEAKTKGFRVGLKTNALNLDTKKIKTLCGIVDDVYLSVDSAFKKIHNALRLNNRSYDRNINIAKKVKRANPHIKVYFHAVVTRLNYKSLDRLLDIAHDNEIDKVSFVQLNSKNKKEVGSLLLNTPQLKQFYFQTVPAILEKSLGYKIPVTINPYFSALTTQSLSEQIAALKMNPGQFDEEIRNFINGDYGKSFYEKNTCYGILDHLTIDWEGNLYPCCAMPRSKHTAIGNVLEKKISEVWNSVEYAQYRQDVLSGKCRFQNKCSRNFKETAIINKYVKKICSQNSNNKILEHLVHQYRHNDYKARHAFKIMVYYASLNSEFYYKKFKDGLKTLDSDRLGITGREELKTLFPAKEVVLNYFQEEYAVYRTSSCGIHAFLYAKPTTLRTFHRMAVSFLSTGRWRLGQPWLKLTSLNCLETAHPVSGEPDYKNNAKDEVVIPPDDNFLAASDSKIRHIYNLLKNTPTRLIHANPSYLKLLLYRMKKLGLRLDNGYAVHSTYELLLPSTEKLIKKYLDCEIYDQYGCSEIGPISFSCKEGKRHIFSDLVYPEIMPALDIGRTDVGRVVITHLKNKVMPFVRYFTGDFAQIIKTTRCTCGFNSPLMGRIVGRQEEIIKYKERCVFPLEIDCLFYDMDNILMYQVIVEEEKFIVRIIPENVSVKTDQTKITQAFKIFFKDEKLQLEVEIVDRIPPFNRRGKYKTVVISRE